MRARGQVSQRHLWKGASLGRPPKGMPSPPVWASMPSTRSSLKLPLLLLLSVLQTRPIDRHTNEEKTREGGGAEGAGKGRVRH